MLILTISSPALSPAASAGAPLWTDVTNGLSNPDTAIIIIESTNASIKLKNGPANTIDILAYTFFLQNALSDSTTSSSPSIMHEPPNGRIFIEYFVLCSHPSVVSQTFEDAKNLILIPLSVLTSVINLGPIPSENSVTSTPLNLASRKCPNSCIITITLKIKRAITIFMINSFLSQFFHIFPVQCL